MTYFSRWLPSVPRIAIPPWTSHGRPGIVPVPGHSPGALGCGPGSVAVYLDDIANAKDSAGATPAVLNNDSDGQIAQELAEIGQSAGQRTSRRQRSALPRPQATRLTAVALGSLVLAMFLAVGVRIFGRAMLSNR